MFNKVKIGAVSAVCVCFIMAFCICSCDDIKEVSQPTNTSVEPTTSVAFDESLISNDCVSEEDYYDRSDAIGTNFSDVLPDSESSLDISADESFEVNINSSTTDDVSEENKPSVESEMPPEDSVSNVFIDCSEYISQDNNLSVPETSYIESDASENNESASEPLKNKIVLSKYEKLSHYSWVSSDAKLALLEIFDLYDRYKNTDSQWSRDWYLEFDFLSEDEAYEVRSVLRSYYGNTIYKSAFSFSTLFVNNQEVGTYIIFVNVPRMRDLEAKRAILDEKIDEIISNMDEGTETEKLKQISDYLADSVVYTPEYTDGYDALLNNKGTCNAFVHAFKFMAERIGIPCDICLGYVDGIYHAWSRVLLEDGTYLYYDISFYNSSRNVKYIASASSPWTISAYNNYYWDR